MSGWTEYLVAEKSDADAIANENNPKERWPGLEGFKFFGPDSLAPLFSILTQSSVTFADFPELAFGEYGWVYEVPPALSTTLHQVQDDGLKGIAEAWSKRLLEEMRSNYTAEQLVSLLRIIREIAIKANEASKPMLLWQSSSC